MDKRKVIVAYQRGYITIHECAQILGIHCEHLRTIVDSSKAENSAGASSTERALPR
ncbi:hypothetical protein PaecuDRAFT_3269 [Paenibacillus curdlanolyticus YK9]|uniref:Uncharacterized protein n=1 Tax=Paenibacillus curdlanolyticus YK9 TaxID=717606 RepID=E0IC80_9BACL|nr:hypothetical protein [Paenibacillus curdlanolyticus]EFM09766.1 hypothetical protein PaecuDRAFT_3269 [Paenibacillus curdlanolyticus YK9]